MEKDPERIGGGFPGVSLELIGSITIALVDSGELGDVT